MGASGGKVTSTAPPSSAGLLPIGEVRRPAGVAAGARFLSFLRAHPGLCLILLSPGIPEYLSGSSPMSALIVSPGWFILQLGLNLSLYAPGVLLIREAKVRWNKGWGTVVLLGAAYAVLEEGIALSTLFNPHSSVVGGLGFYGHWAGVNWVWTAGLLMVHIVYSIALPILLVGLALPETEGRSILTRREIGLLFGFLAGDVTLLFFWVYRAAGFWMSAPVFLGSLAAIGLLTLAAYLLPRDALRTLYRDRTISTGTAFITGLSLFPGVLLIEGLLETWAVPAAITFFLVLAWEGLVAWAVVRHLSARRSERPQLGFALGAIIPLVPFGIVAGFPYDVVLIADGAMAWVFVRLFRKYPSAVTEAFAADGRAPHRPSVAPPT